MERIEFKLEDPMDSNTFSQFLDQPMMITRQESSSRRRKTPCQILEESVFRYAKQFEEANYRRLMVDVSIKRGSFVIGLSFLAAYDFLARYHDFVESITLMRKQIEGLVQDASDWYRILTGRDIQVESSIEFIPSAAKAEKRKIDLPDYAISTLISIHRNNHLVLCAHCCFLDFYSSSFFSALPSIVG